MLSIKLVHCRGLPLDNFSHCSGLLLDNFSLPAKLNEVQHAAAAAGGCSAPDQHQAAICTNCTNCTSFNQTGAHSVFLDNFSMLVRLNEVQHAAAAGGCSAPDQHQAAPVAPIAPDHHQEAICTNCTNCTSLMHQITTRLQYAPIAPASCTTLHQLHKLHKLHQLHQVDAPA